MSLVAGGMFWFVRAVLAAFPSIALRRPIKKWAACAALAIGFVYMLLAGADIATQRSYIMIAIVFFAIIIDRPALSLRNLVLAALIILLLHPESALSASFQMSFMAVMGLAAFYEAWSEWRLKHGQEMRIESSLMRYLRKLVLVAVGAVLTTLIAGTLSSIPAAYHFGRLGLYGVLANGLALPIISLVVMPMALASVLLMPLGLETLPLSIMGKGIDLVLAISDWAASLPGASVTVPLQPAPVAIVAALGFVALCLVKGRARFAGIAIAALAPMFSFLQDRPDLLIERTAANIAVINDNGDLVPAEAKRGRFAVSRWLQAYGDGASPAEASARPAWSCDKRRCISNFKGRKIVYFREGEGNTPDCTGIDVLVAAYPLRGACRNVPLRIDRFDVWRNGAYAIYIEPDGVRVATARGESGERPWVTVPQPRRLAFQPGK
jgi:competence protein ComEC